MTRWYFLNFVWSAIWKTCLRQAGMITDRGVINHASMRLDILYFLGYDVDEELPWHSTLSRTRQLFPDDIFEEVFTKVLQLCIESGLVKGHIQAIDSAPVKANASMDSLEIKVSAEELEHHLIKLRVQIQRRKIHSIGIK